MRRRCRHGKDSPRNFCQNWEHTNVGTPPRKQFEVKYLIVRQSYWSVLLYFFLKFWDCSCGTVGDFFEQLSSFNNFLFLLLLTDLCCVTDVYCISIDHLMLISLYIEELNYWSVVSLTANTPKTAVWIKISRRRSGSKFHGGGGGPRRCTSLLGGSNH